MNVDPIQLELMRNLLEAAAEEMGILLQRASFSANIKERRDFSCALFDDQGRLLAQAAHIPVHLGSMPASVLAVIDRLGPLEEGDLALVNDPFSGGTHLPDITAVSPIFVGGQIIGYAANRAHHADVGGINPGSMTLSRHIDEEGFRIEPTLLEKGGRADASFLNRFLSAVRNPEERQGDLRAQSAANAAGIAAIRQIVERDGIKHLRDLGQALLDYSQSLMARAIADIPTGQWQFKDVLDDDGQGNGPIPIRCALTIEGGQATVDLTASADSVSGCVNCPRAVTLSAVYYCFACLLEERATLNGGAFDPIHVLTRPGSIVHAVYPSAVVAGNVETSQRIVDVVMGALAQAVPSKIPAASSGTMNSVALGGQGWTYYETIGGGCGAGPAWDGESAIQCHMTNTLNTPAEAIEMQYPLRVMRFERAPGTGGAGRYSGGEGIIRELRALRACEGTILTDRRTSAPYGLAGGDNGRRGSNSLLRADGSILTLPGKTVVSLQAGESLRIQTPGGGGWGKAT